MNVLKSEVIDRLKTRKLKPSQILDCVNRELIETVMEQCRDNQSRAAISMGLSRGTFRTKLIQLFGDKYLKRS